MEIILLIIAGVAVYLVSKVLKNNSVAENNLDAIAKKHGLNIFYRSHVYSGIVGLDDTQNAMVWVSKTDKSESRIFYASDVRRVQHETNSFHNKTENKIIFTINDPKNPTFILDFGLGKQPAEDFYQRIGVLFDLT